jgi:hypothetical protein
MPVGASAAGTPQSSGVLSCAGACAGPVVDERALSQAASGELGTVLAQEMAHSSPPRAAEVG